MALIAETPIYLAILPFYEEGVKVTSRCTAGTEEIRAGQKQQAPLAQLAEQLTLNQWVQGSSP